MNDFDQFERRLGAALRSDADERVGPFEAESIAHAAIADTGLRATRLPRASSRPARRLGRGRGMTLLAAAVLVGGGALAAGSGLLRLPTVVPPVPEPSVIAVATASPDATSPSPSESAAPTPVPSATPAPIAWTEASLKEDWPSPVRTERLGPPIVVPTFLKDEDWGDPLVDPTGDTGSADNRWADIKAVTLHENHELSIELVSYPPFADPRQVWIAYGVVVDTDGDGVPDWRYGTDNVPLDTRWWRTDLHTGRTESAVGDLILSDGGWFWSGGSDCRESPGCTDPAVGMSFGHESVGIGEVGGLPKRFYVWASLIQDGRVVATDYAPDDGWLALSADAKP